MSTAFTFSRSIYISDIPAPAKSVGAHLAAKLQCFGTDERTLTDELCDMLCIWLGIENGFPSSPHTGIAAFTITLSKTTSYEEVINGADLELIISSPLGTKRCLIQAKVLEPSSGKLRCNSTAGWEKLRTQLAKARADVKDLAFLLVYVPGAFLNGHHYGYGTYEQGHMPKPKGRKEAFLGATLIAADNLLDNDDHWLDTKEKVPQPFNGTFKSGIPLWRFLMELLLCRRSTWSSEPSTGADRRMPALRTLSIGATDVSVGQWQEFQQSADQWLPNENDVGDDGNKA